MVCVLASQQPTGASQENSSAAANTGHGSPSAQNIADQDPDATYAAANSARRLSLREAWEAAAAGSVLLGTVTGLQAQKTGGRYAMRLTLQVRRPPAHEATRPASSLRCASGQLQDTLAA